MASKNERYIDWNRFTQATLGLEQMPSWSNEEKKMKDFKGSIANSFARLVWDVLVKVVALIDGQELTKESCI